MKRHLPESLNLGKPLRLYFHLFLLLFLVHYHLLLLLLLFPVS